MKHRHRQEEVVEVEAAETATIHKWMPHIEVEVVVEAAEAEGEDEGGVLQAYKVKRIIQKHPLGDRRGAASVLV